MLLKRLLVAVLVGLCGVAFAAGVTDADRAERVRLQQAATGIGSRFAIPVQPALSDPDVVLAILQRAADAHRVNVFRTSWGYDRNDQPLITHYAYIASQQTQLFDRIRLRQGRFPTSFETRAGTAFAATVLTGSPGQVGFIDDIGRNDTIYIRPLAEALASLPAPGGYTVECGQPEACTRFLDQIADQFTRRGAHLEHGALKQPVASVAGEISSGYTPWTWTTIWAVVVGVAILAAFRQLYEAKRAAVLALHGYTALRAWFIVSGRPALITMLTAGLCVISATAFVPGVTAYTVVNVAANVAGVTSLAIIATLTSAIYLMKMNLAQALKSRKDTRLLVALSLALKFAISVTLIVMGTAAADQYGSMSAAQAKLGSWQATSQYGVFAPKSVGFDVDELQNGGLASTSTEVHSLYPILNNRGAIYIDATQYEAQAIQEGPIGRYRSITVNPNYLATYPIMDRAGKPVVVDEHTTDWVLLVPFSLHDQARAITTSFQSSRTGGEHLESVVSLEKRLFGIDPPPEVRNQKVRIVWTADHQDVFTFNPDAAPEQGNRITDPIVAVMTSSNSVGIDRMNGLSGSPGQAIKVKLTAGDPAQTLAQLEGVLRELHLDDNLTHLVTLNDYALEDLQLAQQGLSDAVTAIFATLLLLGLATAQSVTLLFEHNARRSVVRRLHGLPFPGRHDRLLLILALTWSGQTVIAAAVIGAAAGRWGVPQPSPSLFLAAGIFMCIELLIAGTILGFIEHRRMPAILKGEF